MKDDVISRQAAMSLFDRDHAGKYTGNRKSKWKTEDLEPVPSTMQNM